MQRPGGMQVGAPGNGQAVRVTGTVGLPTAIPTTQQQQQQLGGGAPPTTQLQGLLQQQTPVPQTKLPHQPPQPQVWILPQFFLFPFGKKILDLPGG